MRLRSAIALLHSALLLLLLPPALAAAGNSANEATVRAALAQAAAIAHPGGSDQSALQILSRSDLDEDLSRISARAVNVSFYEVQPSANALPGSGSIWAVVSHDSPLEPYGLYDFESAQELQQSALEFNRLVSQLGVSLTDDKASSLARLFLACCALGAPGDVVADEDALHHSVERDYLEVFGQDVYRTLSSFTEWWQGYTASKYQFPPAVEPEPGGAFHIAVERVVLKFGMHPQLQQCNLDISHDGTITVSGIEPIFPEQDRWLSYDSRTDVPQFHSVGDELERLKTLVKH